MVVAVLTTIAFQRTRKSFFLLLLIGAVLGIYMTVFYHHILPGFDRTPNAKTFWLIVYRILYILDVSIWTPGLVLLIKDYLRLFAPPAAPNKLATGEKI